MKPKLPLMMVVIVGVCSTASFRGAAALEGGLDVRDTSAYVRAVLQGDEAKSAALLTGYTGYIVGADVSAKDMDKVIAVARNGTMKVRLLAICLVGKFCTYDANTALIDIMDTDMMEPLDWLARKTCIESLWGNRCDPRTGPAVLREFERCVRRSDLVGMCFAADTLGYRLMYGPAGDPIAAQLKALATGEWWQDTTRLDTMAKLAKALGNLNYAQGPALYNGLLRDAAPHFFKKGAIERLKLRLSQSSFLHAGIPLADKATVMEYVQILGLAGNGAVRGGHLYLEIHNLKDEVRYDLGQIVPWFEAEADSAGYRDFVEGGETLNDLYVAQVGARTSIPSPDWCILNRIQERKLTATLPVIESWCDLTDNRLFKNLFVARMERLGSSKATEMLLSIARAGDPCVSDDALQLLMIYTCANCGRDWDAWQDLIERQKRELKMDLFTSAFQPVEAFEAFQKGPSDNSEARIMTSFLPLRAE